MNLSGVRTIFLDSSPIIYFVEGNPTYYPLVKPIFDQIDQEKLVGYTSAITLSECIFYPLRMGNSELASEFENIITNGAIFIETNVAIVKIATEFRVTYGLKLMDALQLATAIFMNCDLFVTNDTIFRRVHEIRVLIIDDLKEK